MNCLIYVRIAGEELTKETRYKAISNQIQTCKEFIRKNNHQLLEIYEDLAQSGLNINRPGLQDMLLRCRKDKSIDAVLIYDINRLSRKCQDYLLIKAMLKRNNIKIISVSNPEIKIDDPESIFIDQIMTSMLEFESQLLSRKIRHTMQRVKLERSK